MNNIIIENENYVCYVDADSKDADGYDAPYIIMNKEHQVIEDRVRNLTQAYIYIHQMNVSLRDATWKQFLGLDDSGGSVKSVDFGNTKKH